MVWQMVMIDVELAIDMVAYKIKSYVGAYVAALNGIDALCFYRWNW